MIICGIYALIFENTDQIYVGQSINITSRFKSHLYSLKNSKASVKLQRAFNRYGAPDVIILEECALSELNTREEYYIERSKSYTNGFNTCPNACSYPNLYVKGDLHSKVKFSNEEILESFDILCANSNLNLKDVSKLTKLDYLTIKSIANGYNHKWIQEFRPREYLQLMQKIGQRYSVALSSKSQGIVYPIIVSPEGVSYTVENTAEFARLHDLSQGNLHSVLTGNRPTVKGWMLLKNKEQ